MDLGSRKSDHCNLTGLVWRQLREKLGIQGEWDGPEIRVEGKDYIVDWYDKHSEDRLTIYSDGVWQFYGSSGEQEGKILPLHDRRWAKRMVKEGVNGKVAAFTVMFFKGLKGEVV